MIKFIKENNENKESFSLGKDFNNKCNLNNKETSTVKVNNQKECKIYV